MSRRAFITCLAGAALAWPRAGRAQQQAMPVIGLLSGGLADLETQTVRAFRQGLSASGFIEGQNVAIEFRYADGNNDRLPAFAADLVRRKVSVIVALGSTPAALAAKAATATISVVFMVGIDPVQAGLVTSLARPGGNVTGVTNVNTELGPKRLELLHELLPTTDTFALLVNPASPLIAETATRDLQSAAHALGLKLSILNASTERDFETAFATLAQIRASGLLIVPDAFFISHREQLAALTLRHAVPSITQFREFAEAGGLMTYGGSRTELAHQVGLYTGRILKGEKPADLPVQQTMKAELIINLKTAKALGLIIPPTLLARADEVID
jgi:putative tryptophan/tyrosine transport system substrate-binding protein